MAERDGAAQRLTRSGSAPVSLMPCEHDRSEGLVDLESVDAIDRQARARSSSFRVAGMIAVSIKIGIVAGEREMRDRRARLEAEPHGDRLPPRSGRAAAPSVT